MVLRRKWIMMGFRIQKIGFTSTSFPPIIGFVFFFMVLHRLWYDHMTTSKGPPRTARKTAGTRSSTSAERRHRALRDSRMRCSAALDLQDGFNPDQNGNHWGNKSKSPLLLLYLHIFTIHNKRVIKLNGLYIAKIIFYCYYC